MLLAAAPVGHGGVIHGVDRRARITDRDWLVEELSTPEGWSGIRPNIGLRDRSERRRAAFKSGGHVVGQGSCLGRVAGMWCVGVRRAAVQTTPGNEMRDGGRQRGNARVPAFASPGMYVNQRGSGARNVQERGAYAVGRPAQCRGAGGCRISGGRYAICVAAAVDLRRGCRCGRSAVRAVVWRAGAEMTVMPTRSTERSLAAVGVANSSPPHATSIPQRPSHRCRKERRSPAHVEEASAEVRLRRTRSTLKSLI